MATTQSQPLLSTDGRKVSLLGQTVGQVCFSIRGPAVRLILCDEFDRHAELAFDGDLILRRGETALLLTGATPGVTFSPRELHPLMELLGAQVEAVTVKANEIRIYFSNRWELAAGDDDYNEPTWRLRLLKSQNRG